MKIRISVDEVRRLNKRKAEINCLELENIEWIDDAGRHIDVPKAVIEEWNSIGLNNLDFVTYLFDDQNILQAIPKPNA